VRRQGVLRGQSGAGWFAGTKLKPHTNTFSAIVVDGLQTASDGGQGDWSTVTELAVIYPLNSYAERQQLHAYALGDVVVSKTTDANHLCAFVCTTAGTTASGSGPALTAVAEGATVSDGSVVWTATVISGVRLLARAKVDSVHVDGAAGNGITVVCNSGGSPSTNGNNFLLTYCRIDNTGGNGVYIDGSDANAGTSFAVDVSNVRFWGLYDSSFLGNAHYSLSCATCGLGPYKSDNVNAPTGFYNPYTEQSQPPADLTSPAFAIGGQNGAGFTAQSRRWDYNEYSPDVAARFTSADGGMRASLCAGNETISTAFLAQPFDSSQVAIQNAALRWKYIQSGFGQGFWLTNLQDSDSAVALMIATSNQPYQPLAALVAKNGIAIAGVQENGTTYTNAPFIVSGSAAPTSTGTTWKQGDRVLNSAPTELGSSSSKYTITGWICTAGGAPGTWKEMRALTGN
jgi:hypothetical protein